jgi:hypothetical protein
VVKSNYAQACRHECEKSSGLRVQAQSYTWSIQTKRFILRTALAKAIIPSLEIVIDLCWVTGKACVLARSARRDLVVLGNSNNGKDSAHGLVPLAKPLAHPVGETQSETPCREPGPANQASSFAFVGDAISWLL